VTGEVCIGLEQNVIDAAINEWRKCLWAESMFVGQHFKHCCRHLENKQLDKLSVKNDKKSEQNVCFVCFLIKQ